MLTTELAHRVLVTVLLVAIANCQQQQQSEASSSSISLHRHQGENKSERQIEERLLHASDNDRFLMNDLFGSEAGHRNLDIDLDQEEVTRLTRGLFFRNKGQNGSFNKKDEADPSSDSGIRTVVSSTSYSVKPGNGASTVVVNTKPIPVMTSSSGSSSGSSSKSAGVQSGHNKGRPTASSSHYSQDNGQRNNCFGKKCYAVVSPDDEWKSYYSALNGGVHRRNSQENPGTLVNKRVSSNQQSSSNYDGLFTSLGTYSTLPFRVEGAVPGSELANRYVDDRSSSSNNKERHGHRVSRTTTTSTTASTPGWVKLEPLFSSAVYDPFAFGGGAGSGPPEGHKDAHKNDRDRDRDRVPMASAPLTMALPAPPEISSQFSNRIGVELNPESFAERWGWTKDKIVTGGSRPPSWLDDMSSIHDYRRPVRPERPIDDRRDEDHRNWVKLDPVPVAGVTISKWVPKGTQTSELPTTNWPVRDRPNAWWDRVDTVNSNHHHTNVHNHRPITIDTWPIKEWNNHYPSKPHQSPGNAWNDIIYPDGPTSATASWEATKIGSHYPSSFPTASWSASSSIISSGDHRRPPPQTSDRITGSWSASPSGSSRFGNRRPSVTPSSYPDLPTSSDDPRWVLVSDTRRITGGPHSTRDRPQRPSYFQHLDKYQSDIERYFDTGHRHGKDLKKASSPSSKFQEDAFNKINATLQTLIPVLNHRGGSAFIRTTPRPTKGKGSDYPATELSEFLGDGRKKQDKDKQQSTSQRAGRKVLSGINPVYAAVGAGMIPATMAAVLPMVLGRKKRYVMWNPPLVPTPRQVHQLFPHTDALSSEESLMWLSDSALATTASQRRHSPVQVRKQGEAVYEYDKITR